MKRIFVIAIILSTNSSFARPFKAGRLKQISTDPPLKCALFEGLWEGECTEDNTTYKTRLQVYQDGCAELALFDFDNPVPIHYKIGRHSTSGNMFSAAPFYNDTNYSEWIDNFQTLSAKGFFSTQVFASGKNVIYSGDYTFKASMRNGELWTDETSNVISADQPGTIYQYHCEYKKKR